MPARVLSIETPEGALRLASAGILDNFDRWLRFIGHTDGVPIELQVVDMETNYGGVQSRYAYARTLAEAVRLLEESEKWKNAPAAYTIVNDIDPAVATRKAGATWHNARKGHSTSNVDICARTVVFVDVDAKRVRDVTATDEEVARAADVGARVYAKLVSIASTEAVGYGHSGNGRSVFVALDHIPETPELERTVKGVLIALGAMFVVPRVVIDPVVSEAKRLGPAWGTTKRKGAEGFADRPHRRTAFVCAEETRRLDFAELRDLLETLRAELTGEQRIEVDRALGVRPSKTTSAVSGAVPLGTGAFDRANAVSIEQVAEWLGLVEPTGVRCPGCGVQGNSSVAFVGNGLKCLHATCAQKGKQNGFRTPVDLVAECRCVSPREAVELMAEHFHFEGFPAKQQSNGAATPEEERAAGDSYEADERAAIQDEPEKPASSGVEWIGTQDVFFSPLVEPTWIARGLQIGPGRPSMIAGYAWSMKSLASQSFILSVLSGRRLWGTSHLHCRQGRCRHIDFEQGRYPTLRRYRRLVAGMGIDPREFEDRLEVAVFPRGMFLNARSAEETYLRAFDGVDFALVDAYRSSVPGLDENESTAAEPLYMLGRVSEKTGCSVLLNHHAGKGEREDQRQAVRGSSAIFGALGTVLHLEAKKKGEPVRVSQTRGAVGGDGVGEQDFYLEAEDVAIGQDPRAGLRILYRSAEQVSPPISPANVAAAEVERVVAAIRREGQGGVRGADAAAGLAGMKTSRARIVVQIALSRGLLENVARKRSGERDEHRPVYVARDSSLLVPSPLGGDERDEQERGRPGRAKDERDERDEHTENGRS